MRFTNIIDLLEAGRDPLIKSAKMTMADGSIRYVAFKHGHKGWEPLGELAHRLLDECRRCVLEGGIMVKISQRRPGDPRHEVVDDDD